MNKINKELRKIYIKAYKFANNMKIKEKKSCLEKTGKSIAVIFFFIYAYKVFLSIKYILIKVHILISGASAIPVASTIAGISTAGIITVSNLPQTREKDIVNVQQIKVQKISKIHKKETKNYKTRKKYLIEKTMYLVDGNIIKVHLYGTERGKHKIRNLKTGKICYIEQSFVRFIK